MARIILSEDIGRITLDDVDLPGLYQSLTIDDEMTLDEKKRPGRSGTSKAPQGFQDIGLRVRIHLCPGDDGSDPLDEVRTIRELLHGERVRTTAPAYRVSRSEIVYGAVTTRKPRVFRLVNAIANAYGLKRVLFVKVKIVAEQSTDVLPVDLEFVQYRPWPKSRRRTVRVPTVQAFDKAAQDAEAAFERKVAAMGAPVVRLVNPPENTQWTGQWAAPPPARYEPPEPGRAFYLQSQGRRDAPPFVDDEPSGVGVQGVWD